MSSDWCATFSAFTKHLTDYTVTEGASVTLECEVSTPQVMVEWHKDNLPLQSEGRYNIQKHQDKCQLVMDDVALDDEGTFTCCFVGSQDQTQAFFKVQGW